MNPFHLEPHRTSGLALEDIVLGGNDALVSNVALVAAVSAATGDARIVLAAGLASAIAGAASMGVSAYLAATSEFDAYHKERAREIREVEETPEAERQEIRDIYTAKGFTGKDLDRAVEIITSNKERWVNVMMMEELGFTQKVVKPPLGVGVTVTVAFLIASIIPVGPFAIWDVDTGLPIALVLTAMGLIFLGAYKGKFSHRSTVRTSLEMLILGVVAAAVAYWIGEIFGV
ncbi:MAG: VIT1/CCC1 transporter family protein [Candidatus Kerfeldbacteria bacterium]|nr:VIT1/CCC1 transporter family protein [Candidatus Kerfeldbacteria bacterium]